MTWFWRGFSHPQRGCILNTAESYCCNGLKVAVVFADIFLFIINTNKKLNILYTIRSASECNFSLFFILGPTKLLLLFRYFMLFPLFLPFDFSRWAFLFFSITLKSLYNQTFHLYPPFINDFR